MVAELIDELVDVAAGDTTTVGVELAAPSPPKGGVELALVVPMPLSTGGAAGVEVAVVVPVPVSTGGVLLAVLPVSGVVLAVSVEVASTTTGGGSSHTPMPKVAGVALFPAASVAVHVTVVVPIANIPPEAGVQEARPVLSKSSEVPGDV